MVLDILEVSQKQAFIFSSNKLRENVANSAAIAYVTDSAFFKDSGAPYDETKNLVYSGGGHTVLQFETKADAVAFNKAITKTVLERFPYMEMFVKVLEYDGSKTPHENLNSLISALEIKKSDRTASFRKGSYGIEKIDSDTMKPKRCAESKVELFALDDSEEWKFVPEGYRPVYEFSDLGGSKGEANFIAVVHIDGNGMGKRVNDFQETYGDAGKDWEPFAKEIGKFSKSLDNDFKQAYREMTEEVANKIEDGTLSSLNLKDKNFPIRRIISSGDDICYVADGRIGIESARIFIEKLNGKINEADKRGYSACAGVAIVHAKYPFYRAYELAEELCSNAKAFGAGLSNEDNGACISSIDWHIEFGELGDDLSSIRSLYVNEEGKYLNMRPYIISAPKKICEIESTRQYKKFKIVEALIMDKENGYARSSIKNLRSVLRRSESDAKYYLTYHKIDELAMTSYQGTYKDMDTDGIGSGKGLEGRLFVRTADGRERSTLFDAIEMMDTFINLD